MIQNQEITTNVSINEKDLYYIVIKPTKIQAPNLQRITLENGRVVTIKAEYIKGDVDYKENEKDKHKEIENLFYVIFDGKQQLSNLLQIQDPTKDNFLNFEDFKIIDIGNKKFFTPGKKSILGKEKTGKICNYPYPKKDVDYQLRIQLDNDNLKCPDYYTARHNPKIQKVSKLEPGSETIYPPSDYCEKTGNCAVRVRPNKPFLENPVYESVTGGKTKKRKTRKRNKRKSKTRRKLSKRNTHKKKIVKRKTKNKRKKL
jgi:hypothetical protein